MGLAAGIECAHALRARSYGLVLQPHHVVAAAAAHTDCQGVAWHRRMVRGLIVAAHASPPRVAARKFVAKAIPVTIEMSTRPRSVTHAAS